MRAVVGHDRHRERVVLGQEGDREELGQLAPEHVERELRAGHVGDDQVEQPRGEVQPRGLGEDRRRREVLHADSTSAPTACLDSFRPSIAALHEAQARDRVLDVDRQRPAHHRDAVAQLRRARRSAADRDRHQRAQLEPLGAHAARAAATGAARRDTTVSTTSLTVPPNAFLTALKSSRRPRTTAKRRCGPISTFSGVSGAGFRPAQTISPRPSAASRRLDRALGLGRGTRPRAAASPAPSAAGP